MTDKKILAIATKEVGEFSRAKVVWLIQPLLEQMALAFAAYVGLETKAENGKSLLAMAMKNAMVAYHGHEEDERAAIAAFVVSLLDNSVDVFSQQVIVDTKRGQIVWSPFAGSLTDFLAAHPGMEVTVTRQPCAIPASIAKTFMMTKIIPHTLLDQASLADLFNDATLVV